MRIEFYRHNISEEDIARVADVLRGPFLTTGKVVEEFEEKLADYLGCKYVIGVSSCTTALHLSLSALGIGTGDEVITTPMTFAATSNSILYTGASPVFVDVAYKNGLIHPNEIAKVLSPNTRAIMPVHLYGQVKFSRPKHMDYLCIVEDAAHAIESSRRSKESWNYVNCACFSFYTTKSITSGEGGAIATNSELLADRIKALRNHGMTKSAADRYGRNYQHWDIEILGYNYRMTNFQAALLLGQLDHIDEYCDRRREICGRYEEAFKNNPRIRLIEANEKSARLMFTILVEDRDKILRKLQDEGIGVAVNYRAVHLLSYYRELGYQEGDFPVAEEIGNKTITLPLYPKLKDEEVEYIVKIVNGVTMR